MPSRFLFNKDGRSSWIKRQDLFDKVLIGSFHIGPDGRQSDIWFDVTLEMLLTLMIQSTITSKCITVRSSFIVNIKIKSIIFLNSVYYCQLCFIAVLSFWNLKASVVMIVDIWSALTRIKLQVNCMHDPDPQAYLTFWINNSSFGVP